jgi:hypothetical protein
MITAPGGELGNEMGPIFWPLGMSPACDELWQWPADGDPHLALTRAVEARLG